MNIFDFVKINQKTLTISFDKEKQRYNFICPVGEDNYGFCIEDKEGKENMLEEALEVGFN